MSKTKLELVTLLLEKMEDPKYKRFFDLLQLEAKDWTQIRRTCTKCGHEGPVDPDFGTRKRNGVEFAQGWCRKCRATTNYPRPNRVR